MYLNFNKLVRRAGAVLLYAPLAFGPVAVKMPANLRYYFHPAKYSGNFHDFMT